MRNELGSAAFNRWPGPVFETLFEPVTAAGPLLDERAVAQRLGCSEKTVARLRKSGKLSFVTVGRQIRYRLIDLAEYYLRNQRPAAA